ncbi:MAG: hypothetical protein LUF85_14870 [Bacteroides sp.]|nr:hypothetical protein [Bacteroides sp.]
MCKPYSSDDLLPGNGSDIQIEPVHRQIAILSELYRGDARRASLQADACAGIFVLSLVTLFVSLQNKLLNLYKSIQQPLIYYQKVSFYLFLLTHLFSKIVVSAQRTAGIRGVPSFKRWFRGIFRSKNGGFLTDKTSLSHRDFVHVPVRHEQSPGETWVASHRAKRKKAVYVTKEEILFLSEGFRKTIYNQQKENTISIFI